MEIILPIKKYTHRKSHTLKINPCAFPLPVVRLLQIQNNFLCWEIKSIFELFKATRILVTTGFGGFFNSQFYLHSHLECKNTQTNKTCHYLFSLINQILQKSCNIWGMLFSRYVILGYVTDITQHGYVSKGGRDTVANPKVCRMVPLVNLSLHNLFHYHHLLLLWQQGFF